MRELTVNEITSVSGGFRGTRVPFSNSRFFAGRNWGGPVHVLTGISLAWGAGTAIGQAINWFNTNVNHMSFGEALYKTTHPSFFQRRS